MGNNNINNMPLVSIVTPNYNGMPFLKTTIESIRNQDYPNIEHIVFDGHSTDGSVELLKSYPEIKWVSEKDKGQSHALNKGFAIARGEIIGWLNSDDTYTDGAIKKAVNFLLENPSVDMVGTDVNIIDENDFIIGKATGGDVNVFDLLKRNLIKQPSLFMKRVVLEKLSGVNEDFHYIMDQEFWVRAFMNGIRFKYLENECFANFRLIKGTKTFDAGPAFNLEWHKYTLTILQNDYFSHLTDSQKNDLISYSYMKLYFSRMQLAFSMNDKISAIKFYFKSIISQPSVIFNLGLTKLLLLGILNRKHDMLLKFKRNVKKL